VTHRIISLGPTKKRISLGAPIQIIKPSTIFLRPPTRAKKFIKSRVGRALTSPKTALALGATLCALQPAACGIVIKQTGKFFFGSLKRTALTATGIGVLQTSPKARAFVKGKLRDPTGIGRGIGGIIEDPSQLVPKGPETGREKVLQFLKTAGLVGGAAALGGVAIGAFRRFRDRPRQVRGPIGADVLGAAILPATPTIISQPLGVVEKPPKEEPTTVTPSVAAPAMVPDIKIINKPEINIRFSKSKRFINQQVLIRR